MLTYLLYCIALFSTDYSVYNTDNEESKCRTIVEARLESGTGFEVYRNKFSIPAVDKDGKMLFQIDVEKKGSDFNMILSSAKNCLFESGTDIHLNLLDGKVVTSQISLNKDSQVVVALTEEHAEVLSSNSLVSIQLTCKKTSYDLLLKNNQARLLRDVITCIKS